jgi:hypothetical protein
VTQHLLTQLAGRWAGSSRLFFEEQQLDSPSTAEVRALGQGKFVALAYTWEHEGQPQDGLIVFATEGRAATWLDSWHMGDSVMQCEVTREGDAVSLRGSYPAPPGPDWGWRIKIAHNDSELEIRMFNLSPDGQEWPAVAAVYGKAG